MKIISGNKSNPLYDYALALVMLLFVPALVMSGCEEVAVENPDESVVSLTTTSSTATSTSPSSSSASSISVASANGTPSVAFVQSSNDFGNISIGARSVSVSFTLNNSGDGGTTACDAAVLSGAEADQFRIVEDLCNGVELGADQSCAIKVKAAPTSVGEKNATLSISCGAGSSASTSTDGLSVTGVAPQIIVSASTHNFGIVAYQESSDPYIFTFTNSGAAIASGCSAPVISGTNASDFEITTDNCGTSPMAAGGSCTVEIAATPLVVATRTATLSRTCTQGGTASTTTNGIQVTGDGPWINISPYSYAFGTVITYGERSSITFTISNISANTVTGCNAPELSGSNPGDFIITQDNCGTSDLAPGGSCTILLKPSPASTGSKSATLQRSCLSGGTVSTTSNQITVTMVDPVPLWGPDQTNLVCKPIQYVTNAKTVGTTMYVSGDFTRLYPQGSGGILNATTGETDTVIRPINGTVYAAVSDGDGGWFVGGQFTAVGTVSRNNLAHFSSDGALSNWNPGANGSVRALYFDGTYLWVGGAFTQIAGIARTGLGRLLASTGADSNFSWNTNAGGVVYSFANYGNILYIVGSFTTLGGIAYGRGAAINTATLGITGWNPLANGQISAVAVKSDGSVIYVGGSFTQVRGGVRNYLAAVSSANVLQAFTPTPNSSVGSLKISGSILYVGGAFTIASGVARNRLAAYSTITNAITAWAPSVSAGSVFAIDTTADGSTIYVGGSICGTVAGSTRSSAAAITSGGAIASWDPRANSNVQVIKASGDKIFVGGAFTHIGGAIRNSLAAIDLTTGRPTSWSPAVNSSVVALEYHNGKLFIGGGFSVVDGQTRQRLAVYDTANHSLTSDVFNATGGSVSTFLIDDNTSTLYVAGNFTAVNGVAGAGLRSINVSTMELITFAPSVTGSGSIMKMKIDGNWLYLAGGFSRVSGADRYYLARIDTSTGALSDWNPNPNNTVWDLSINQDIVYLVGDFTDIGGQARSYIAAVDDVGNLTDWAPVPNNPARAVYYKDGNIYIGGVFTSINGQTRNGLASVSAATGVVTSFAPSDTAGSFVSDFFFLGDTLIIPSASSFYGQSNPGLVYILPTGVALPW